MTDMSQNRSVAVTSIATDPSDSKPERSKPESEAETTIKSSLSLDSSLSELHSQSHEPRSRSLPEIFRVLHRSQRPRLLSVANEFLTSPHSLALHSPKSFEHETGAARPKHIPIVIPEWSAELPFKPSPSKFRQTEFILPTAASADQTLEQSDTSSPSKGPKTLRKTKRYVEITIPQTICGEDPSTTSEPQDSPLQLGFFPTPRTHQVAPIMSGTPSRSNTINSTDSPPSPDQLDSKAGGFSNYSSKNASQTSLDRREDEEPVSESERVQRSGSTPQQPSAKKMSPNAGQSTASSSSSGSSHLSGLVCNVHRTTGKEPHALVGASTTVLGDKLFVFGGRRISRSRPSLTSDLYELDLLRRHWTKIDAKGDIPPPRYFHSMCTLGDNKLVCYGGMSPEVPTGQPESITPADQSESQVSVMSDVHIYDAPTQTWMRVDTPEAPQGRYAHCAAILPSSAVFASADAPMSAINHNPASNQPNHGSIGVSLDGTGGAEMVVVGGQDSANHYIEQISIFNLRSLKWTSTKPMPGRSCGAYRSVVTPLTSMNAQQIGNPGAKDDDDDCMETDDPTFSGSPMIIYTNYNFLDVKLELQVRLPDGSLVDRPMRGAVSPPGLRFPSGGIIDNSFVVAGTFLTSSKQEFALWSLDLRTLTWARIDVASSIFSSGSWNRGVIWARRNAFVILGNRKRNLVDDYNNRRLNFTNIALVQLEAFGLYDNPRKSQPLSDYGSISAPASIPQSVETLCGGRHLGKFAITLGEKAIAFKELADMDFMAIDGMRLPVNSRIVAKRWGPSFNMLIQEANPAQVGTDTQTLRPSAASITSRMSSMTITPSISTGYSGSTTLASGSTSSTLIEAADVRAYPPNSRPRTLYLPHTYPTIQTLIYYLYTSSLPPITSPLVTPQILCSLLQIARPYKIDGLLEAVVERLHASLDGRNAAAIFNAAAMGAGGGDGVVFASDSVSAHPPRNASLAGISVDGLGLTTPGTTSRNTLRIDTGMANGTGTSTRNGSIAEGVEDEEEHVPDSASTTASMNSQAELSRKSSKREEREVWEGGWSAVIGLQKRGLRGLMEGRRIRERGKTSEGPPANGDGTARVGLGIA